MGVIIRQSFISTSLTYLGVIIGYINILILFPKYMSPDQVGLARIIQDAAMLFVPLGQLGLSQLIIKFSPQYQKKAAYPEFVGFTFLFMVAAILLFSTAFFLFNDVITAYFSQHSEEVNLYIFYIFGLTLILVCYHTLVAYSQSALNIVLPNFLKEILLRLMTLVAIVLFAMQLISFGTFINILVGSYLLNLIILLTYLTQHKVLRIKFQFEDIDWSSVKRMVGYALFTFLGASGILIVGKVDSFMVTGMLGLTEAAIYTTAFYIAVLVELPKRAISQISMPIISKSFERQNMQEVSDIYRKSALNNMLIGMLILIGLAVNLQSIFMLIPRSEIYVQGSMVVLIIGAAKLFDMSFGLNGEVILMSKYYKINIYLIIFLAIITVVANYIFIPLYGLTGAAWGSAIAFFIFNITKYLLLYIKLGLQPFTKATLIGLFIGAIVLAIGWFLPDLTNTIFSILYKSIIVTLVYVSLVYFFIPRQELHFEIDKIITRFLK
jgi:O-antigen/teichoic acid export membrane protein